MFPARELQGHFIDNSFQIGKYLVSPLTRGLVDGQFSAGVSIRCGTGSMTHDRVLRFTPHFPSADLARRFATDQARHWIDGSARR